MTNPTAQNTYNIRQLTPDDVDTVLDLENDVFAAENDGNDIPRKERNNRWMPWATRLDQEIVIGSFKDGALACLISAEDQNPGGSEASYKISAVITHPTHQRQGHARAVMEKTLQAIHEKSPTIPPHLFVDHSKRNAQKLYEAFGFSADPDRGYTAGGTKMICMVLNRPPKTGVSLTA